MKQFLRNIISPTALRLGKGTLRAAPSPKKNSKGPTVTMLGVAISCMVAGYLVQELPAALSSLLVGFAPLIGLAVLLIIVAALISLLICTVERTLADEDDCTVPKPHRKSKWRRVTLSLLDLLARSLSLKEHSPPAFLFS